MTMKNSKSFQSKVRKISLCLRAIDLPKLAEETKNIELTNFSSATKAGNQDMELIIDKISKDRKVSKSEALSSLAAICQLGVTANKANGDKVKVTLNSGTEFSLQFIRKIVKEVTRNSLR